MLLFGLPQFVYDECNAGETDGESDAPHEGGEVEVLGGVVLVDLCLVPTLLVSPVQLLHRVVLVFAVSSFSGIAGAFFYVLYGSRSIIAQFRNCQILVAFLFGVVR